MSADRPCHVSRLSPRSNASPTRRYPDVGFRVARRISPSDTKP